MNREEARALWLQVRTAPRVEPRSKRAPKNEDDPQWCTCHYKAFRGATTHKPDCQWWKSRPWRPGKWDRIKNNERHVLINGLAVRVADNTTDTKIHKKGMIK